MALQPIKVRSCSECANAHLGRGGVKRNLSNTKHRESIAIAILAHTHIVSKKGRLKKSTLESFRRAYTG